jgi:hypothetical protein
VRPYPAFLNAQSDRAFVHSGTTIGQSAVKVNKYNAEMMKYYEDHRIFERMTRLKQQSPHMTRKQVRHQLNALDRDMGRAMLHTENQLRIPLHKYVGSPDLHKAGLLLRYWKSCLVDFYHRN